mmetsp:Transcript_26197/g.77501  ORF Transcript_26197/g.77501 Transcript_26197/m.77501 type:complete len:514 (-) Transcript_26197:158-1699(-)
MAEEDGNGAPEAIAHPTESISHMFSRIRRYDSIRLWHRHGVIADEEFGAVDSLRLKLWREVEKRLISDPSLAEKVSGSAAGSLPLFRACDRTRAPLTAIQCLIAAYPDALTHRENLGRSPLFPGCCNLDAGVFRELLYANRSACTLKDENGLLPHHFAAVNHGADLYNLWLLCEVYPDGANTLGVRKNTPLHDLCHAVKNERCLALVAECGALNDDPSLRGFWDSRAFGKPTSHVVLLWARLHLLLMAAYYGRVPPIPHRDEIEKRGDRLVRGDDLELSEGTYFSACHAAAGCGAPTSVSRAVARFYRREVERTDRLGRLPLHLAAACGRVARFYCDTCIRWKSERSYRQMSDGDLFVQKMCRECFAFAHDFALDNDFRHDEPILFPSLNGKPRHLDDDRLFCCGDVRATRAMERESTVEMLLGAHPRGALQRDADGYLPIHHAAQSGDMEGCFLPLFRMHPRSLEAVVGGKASGKNCWQLAVEAAQKSQTKENIEVVFRMLQLNPAVLEACC